MDIRSSLHHSYTIHVMLTIHVEIAIKIAIVCISMSRVCEGMEHARNVMLQQPLVTSMPLSEETLPEHPTGIGIKDLPPRLLYTCMYMHVCI